MVILLNTVGLYLNITRVTVSESFTLFKVVVNFERWIEQVADRSTSFVQITMAAVNMSCRADDQLGGPALNFISESAVTSS